MDFNLKISWAPLVKYNMLTILPLPIVVAKAAKTKRRRRAILMPNIFIQRNTLQYTQVAAS